MLRRNYDDKLVVFASDTFDKIITAAKNADTHALLEIKKNNSSIDAQATNRFTPAAVLAYLGDQDAVMFLINHGADAGKAAVGAAAAGNIKLAETLRAKFGAGIDKLACGAAMTKNTSYAKELQKQYVKILYPLMMGYAMSGNQAEIAALINHDRQLYIMDNDPEIEDVMKHVNESKEIALGMMLEDVYFGCIQADSMNEYLDICQALQEELADLMDDDKMRDYFIINHFEVAAQHWQLLWFYHIGLKNAGIFEVNTAIKRYEIANLPREEINKYYIKGLADGGHIHAAAEFMHDEKLDKEIFKPIIISHAIRNGHYDLVMNCKELNLQCLKHKPFKTFSGEYQAEIFSIPLSLLVAGDIDNFNKYVKQLPHGPAIFLNKMYLRSSVFTSWNHLKDLYPMRAAEKLSLLYAKFPDSSHIKNMEKIYLNANEKQKKAMMIFVLDILESAMFSVSKMQAQHLMRFMDPQFLESIINNWQLAVEETIRDKTSFFENEEAFTQKADAILSELKTALKVRTIMLEYDYNVAQAEEFIRNKDLRNYFTATLFGPLSNTLSSDTTHSVLSNVTDLSRNDVHEMQEKYRSVNK